MQNAKHLLRQLRDKRPGSAPTKSARVTAVLIYTLNQNQQARTDSCPTPLYLLRSPHGCQHGTPAGRESGVVLVRVQEMGLQPNLSWGGRLLTTGEQQLVNGCLQP